MDPTPFSALAERDLISALQDLLRADPSLIPGDQILPLFSHPSREIRDLSVQVMALTENPSYVPALIKELNRSSLTEKPYWIRLIGNSKDPAGVLSLLDLWKETNADVLDALAGAFSSMGTPAFSLLVGRFLPFDREAKIRVIRAFSRAGFHCEVFLSEGLKSADWWIRREAVLALSRWKTKESLDLIALACTDPFYAVRLEAVKALAVSGDSSREALIKKMTRDPHLDVASAAAGALYNRAA